MKIIYALRHAKAASEDGDGDVERPLANRGRKAAAAMGKYLAALGQAPRLVLCSSARRTRETLDQVMPSLHPAPKVLYEDKLYLASAGRLMERLQELPGAIDSVLLIGHNPGLHQLVLTLAGGSEGLAEGFPTAALAVLRVSGSWEALRPHGARLIDYRTPKSLNHDSEADPD